MISQRECCLLQAQEGPAESQAHQESVPGWGWTRFKMGASGSCLWGQAHRGFIHFLVEKAVESEGRLDKWFLASRTTIVRLSKE